MLTRGALIRYQGKDTSCSSSQSAKSTQRNRVFRKKPGFFPQLTPPPLRHWALAQAGVLLLWLPWLKPFVGQAAGVYREFWLPAPTWSRVAGAIHDMMSAFLPSTVAGTALLWALYIAATLSGIRRLRARPARLALLVALFVAPITGELLVSLRRPIFYDRTLIWVSIPLYVLFATGIAPLAARTRPLTWRRGLVMLAALGLLVALNTLSLHAYYAHFQKEQWDDAAAYVAHHARDGDLVLYHASWTQLPFDFYLDTDRAITQHGLPVDLFGHDVLEPKMEQADLPRLYDVIRNHDRIWLVYSHNWYTDPQNLIPAALASRARLVSRQPFYGLEIYLYQSFDSQAEP